MPVLRRQPRNRDGWIPLLSLGQRLARPAIVKLDVDEAPSWGGVSLGVGAPLWFLYMRKPGID